MIANYYTAADIARVLDVDRKRVFEWKRQGVIAPALTKGEEQYARADVLKLAVMLALKDLFGERSGQPAKLVITNHDEFVSIAEVLDDDARGVEPLVVNLRPHPDDVGLRIQIEVEIVRALRDRLAEIAR